jgi:hypothetical protein
MQWQGAINKPIPQRKPCIDFTTRTPKRGDMVGRKGIGGIYQISAVSRMASPSPLPSCTADTRPILICLASPSKSSNGWNRQSGSGDRLTVSEIMDASCSATPARICGNTRWTRRPAAMSNYFRNRRSPHGIRL